MADTLLLQVVSPERVLVEEQATEIQIPALDGFIGVLPGHAPLLTELGAGILTFNKGGETRSMTVIDGFAEVLPNRVIVLADESERVEDINAGEARVELEKAQHDMPKAGASEEDWERANAAIARATVRVQAAEKSGSGSGAARELQPTH